MRKQFLNTMLSLDDSRNVLLFGDVSVHLFDEWKNKNPDRFRNVGICENAIISAGAGLASQGLTPVMHTIAPFITERCHEQIKLDFCHNGFGGNILSCGASFDYAWDGATHQCFSDLLLVSKLPNTEVMQPGSKKELDVLLRGRYKNDKLKYYRMSDHPHGYELHTEFGKAVVFRDNARSKNAVTVMTAGPILANVLPALADLPVNIVYFHTIKPIDRDAIMRFKDTKIVVIHDAHGLHEAITGLGLAADYHGLPDSFCDWYGTLEQTHKKLCLDSKGIRERIQAIINMEKRR